MFSKKVTQPRTPKRVLRGVLFPLVALTLTIFAAYGRSGALNTPPPVEGIAQHIADIEDLQATLTVKKLDSKELEKIGRDFSLTYRLRNLTLFYQRPDKIRLEGSSRLLGDALFILNGSRRFYAVPKLGLRKTEELEKTPVKRQSLLEYAGLLSRDTLTFMTPTLEGEEEIEGERALRYRLAYKGDSTLSFYRIWLNPKTKITIKRAWFDGEKRLKATFLYREPKEAKEGFWMPAQCEIRNAEDATAAILFLDDIKVNQKLPAKQFEIKE